MIYHSRVPQRQKVYLAIQSSLRKEGLCSAIIGKNYEADLKKIDDTEAVALFTAFKQLAIAIEKHIEANVK